MPALAKRMSSRPKLARAFAAAARSAERSRWSSVASHQRPAGFGKFVARRRRNLKCRADRPGNIDAHDIGTLAGEGDSDRATDPAGSAGDDGSFAGKPTSGSLLRLWFCLSHDAFLRW
jgi:hypothetical protein